MDIVKDMLLWEKWRPKKIEDIILPNRILDLFRGGVTKNYIFYGNWGTGKTSLARILIGRYTKDKAYLEINSSLYTSIDTLRNDIERFCKTVPMFESDDPIKYVFLDEFDRVSPQYQDALKAFIEQYHHNVRFILTTNHFNKISEGIKSRFHSINFDVLNKEEERDIKVKIYKKFNEIILPKEGIEISKEDLVKIINRKFPDIRSILVQIQSIVEGESTTNTDESIGVNSKLISETIGIITKGDIEYGDIWNFLMESYGSNNIDSLFQTLGRPFIKWSMENGVQTNKIFQFNYIVTDYRKLLDDSSDPIILGMTVIGKFREIYNS
jgi:DNA polymerase III delta prime subunit